MLRVCYLFQDDYPWDIRVEKIMTSLADHGMEGHIISRNEKGLQRNQQIHENLYVHRLPCSSNRHLNKLINFPAFFSPFWLKAVVAVIRKTAADMLIVRDLPLSPTGLIAGRLASIPVLLDMAENYPAMIMDTWTYRGPSLMDRVVRNPWALKRMERMVLPRFDGILVVSKFSAERVVRIGCNKDVVSIVSNTPRLNELQKNKKPDYRDDVRSRSEFVLLYIGGLEETRGLETVIRALPEIIQQISDALFVVVGKGTSERSLKNLVRHLRIESHVIFKGWVPHNNLQAIIHRSDVGLVPHFVTEHTETTVPNKIFDYMAGKKPVVVSNAKPLKEIVESCHCGLVYQNKDHHDLANQIIKLKDKTTQKRLGQSGYDAVEKKYNWNFDEKVLISALQKLPLKNGSRSSVNRKSRQGL